MSRSSFAGSYAIGYVSPAKLLCTERHSLKRAARIAARIQENGFWTKPILVEETTLAVMDGHHRRAAALLLGVALVPIIALSYNDARLTLSALRPQHIVTAEHVLAAARTGQLYPYKTTRHRLNPAIPRVAIPLATLMPDGA